MGRDPVDDWLNAQVEPLAPPPGRFERIRRQARRRKARRAGASAVGAAIVLAAALTVPRVATSLQSHTSPPSRPVAIGTPSVSAQPRPTGTGSDSPSSKSSRKLAPPTSGLSAAGSGDPVPQNFQPTSVTFVGAIGAVIGQAGTQGHCATAYCTSLAGTSNYGSTWYGVSAPVTGGPEGSSGVSQIRFLNTSDGWAFGPQLWVTHDGGRNWTQEDTDGMRVTDLETAGNRAFALFATCTGSGPDYAAACTAFSLYTSTAGSDQWQPAAGPVSGLGPAGSGLAASASLVLTESQGYLLAPSGELLSGPLTGGAWTVASKQEPCLPGAPLPDGQPEGALLAADASELVLVCASGTDNATDSQTKTVLESSDNGVSWSAPRSVGPAGIATSVATQGQGSLVVLATDAGIYLSGNGGNSWDLVQGSPAGATAGAGGFSYIGMTSPLDGVALPADPLLHEVYITTDGGRNWQAHAVASPS
jgi:hypothetical protein